MSGAWQQSSKRHGGSQHQLAAAAAAQPGGGIVVNIMAAAWRASMAGKQYGAWRSGSGGIESMAHHRANRRGGEKHGEKAYHQRQRKWHRVMAPLKL